MLRVKLKEAEGVHVENQFKEDFFKKLEMPRTFIMILIEC